MQPISTQCMPVIQGTATLGCPTSIQLWAMPSLNSSSHHNKLLTLLLKLWVGCSQMVILHNLPSRHLATICPSMANSHNNSNSNSNSRHSHSGTDRSSLVRQTMGNSCELALNRWKNIRAMATSRPAQTTTLPGDKSLQTRTDRVQTILAI